MANRKSLEGKEERVSGYKKMRYYLLTENILIVLAFLLLAVGVYFIFVFGMDYLVTYLYLIGGAILLIMGITIALRMIKAFSREDIPAYTNILASEDTDPETGLLYYDNFSKRAEIQMELALSTAYLATYQIEGIEHLRHFVGYQKAADTVAEIGNIFTRYQNKMGERHIICGCKSGHEIVMFINDMELKDVQEALLTISNEINETLYHLATAENFMVYCGYSQFPLQAGSFDEMVKNTSFAVYEATLFRKSEPHCFSPESLKRQETEFKKDSKIKILLDNNALLYKFQPIVSAKTGKIYAYEALMRTNKEMGLSPTDVLELADRQDRLYEVEHYTFFNVIKIMNEHNQMFDDRKLFINSIPTAILKETEFDELLKDYGAVMKHLVIEITENGMQSEESCETVHKYMSKSGCELALDDYGTGYSNASTLLNNSPHYLKIDHSMIKGIDSDSKKQHLVSNYISFANNHDMKILAEGVETPEELQMVIQLGCHLIQGFYTGRPNTEIIERIDEKVEDEIVAINLKLAKLAVENKVYETSNFENISIVDLALDFYSRIQIMGQTTRIVGEKDREVNMSIKIADNLEAVMAIRDINMRGRDMPAIELGENSKLILCVEGDNVLSYEGIRVPASSKLIVQGNGNLTVRVDHNNGIGIGSSLDSPYGNILFESSGTIRVEINGDTAVCIGGMKADENSEIKLESGNFEIIANGSRSIGIGAMEGDTKIILNRCKVAISSSGADAVGIGSFSGDVDIATIADIEMDVSGSNSTGIGALYDAGGQIRLNAGLVNVNMHAMEGVCIGSNGGNTDIYIFGEEILVYGEGSDIGGIGNYRGSGHTFVRTGAVKIVLLAANPISLGGLKGSLEITGGNLYCDLTNGVQPVNGYGEPVYHKVVDSEEVYSKKIETQAGSYQYIATPSTLFDHIHIYVPKFCNEQDLQR